MTNKYDIATAMNSIMASPRHQAVFAKPQPQFTKTAADKNDKSDSGDKIKDAVAACKKLMKDMKCGGSVKASGDTVIITCSDKDAVKKCKAICKKHGIQCEVKVPKESKASRYHACVMGLAKISEYLDDAGLSKEASYTLLALDGLVRNAMPSGDDGDDGDDGDCGMAKDKKKKTTHEHGLDKHTHEDDDDPECHVHEGKKTKNLSEKEEESLGKKKKKNKFPFNDDKDDEDDCGTDSSYADTDDIFQAPAGEGFEEGLDFLGVDSIDFPLGEQWLAELDEEELDPKNSLFRRMKRQHGDMAQADTDDIFQAPAGKSGEGLEEGMGFLGVDPVDFPLGEQWLAELDEEELDPKNSPLERMKRKKQEDLRAKMDEGEQGEGAGEDEGSYLAEMIDETLEGQEGVVGGDNPLWTGDGTGTFGAKKLTSLQKVALELRKARQGVRRPF